MISGELGGPHSWSDAELARRCSVRPTDDTAWRELWGRMAKLVQWRIQRVSPKSSASVIEELTAETFQRLFENIADYDPERARLSTFVLKIAENIARDTDRKRWRELAQTVPAGQLVSGEPVDAASTALPFDFLADVLEAVRKQLNQKQLRVFNLMVEGMIVAEVARTLNLSETTTRRIKDECVVLVTEVVRRMFPQEK